MTDDASRSRPLIVFDGLCAICSASARLVLRHDRRRRFLLTTAQSAAGRAAYLQSGVDPDAMSTMVVIADGVAYTRSDAVIRVWAGLDGAWPAVAGLARLAPPTVRDFVYDWVAGNRYRWVRQRDTCWLPPPEARDRFL